MTAMEAAGAMMSRAAREIEALRGALERIASGEGEWDNDTETPTARQLARTALAEHAARNADL